MTPVTKEIRDFLIDLANTHIIDKWELREQIKELLNKLDEEEERANL